MKTQFNVPTRSEVTENHQAIFDGFTKNIGFVPNLFATMAHSDHGLETVMALQNSKSSINKKEREVINLVVSQINECRYCQSAHTAIGKMNGFTEEQVLELRGGTASFNEKYDALAKLVGEITKTHGKPSQTTLEKFFEVGYTQGNLVDALIVIGDKIIANYLHNITQAEIDFPLAVELEAQNA